MRPNLHVQDYADLCKLLLTAPSEKIANQIFNCGYQNMTIMEIAQMVKEVVEQEFPEKAPIEIVTTPTTTTAPITSIPTRCKNVLGFTPKHTIEEAVRDLCRAFREGKTAQLDLPTIVYYNVNTLKKPRPPDRSLRSSHGWGGFHRQPHGGLAAGPRVRGQGR